LVFTVAGGGWSGLRLGEREKEIFRNHKLFLGGRGHRSAKKARKEDALGEITRKGPPTETKLSHKRGGRVLSTGGGPGGDRNQLFELERNFLTKELKRWALGNPEGNTGASHYIQGHRVHTSQGT